MVLRALAIIFLLTSAAACTASTEPTQGRDGEVRQHPSPDRPNILIIVTDDQRADRTLRVMPATRSLFQGGGVTFANAFATTPQCCPSRASLMTGRYAHNHGVLENEDGGKLDPRLTLQHKLREAGYRTAMTGKFLQGRSIGDRPENFDKWAVTGWGYYSRQFNVQGKIRVVTQYSTRFMADMSVRWLRRFETAEDGRPWFLYVAPTAPHAPYEPEDRYLETSVPPWKDNPASLEADRRDKVPYVRTSSYSEARSGIYERQLRTLLSVDDMVRKIFRVLRKLDEERDTLAFFLSDNGHMNGEHGLFAKRMPYIQSVRIPMLMRWPGHVAEGTRDHRLVANIDLAPTVLEAAGISTEEPPDGASLLGSWDRDYLLLEEYLNGFLPDWRSLISEQDQYIEYLSDEGTVKFAEYYNLRKDPWELHNLLARRGVEKPRRVLKRSQALQEVADCAGSSCP